MKVENYYLKTATDEKGNKNSLRLKDLKVKDKKGIILERRVKSSINLEMIFFIEGIQFETVDNWVKTNSSISMLETKLKTLGVVTDDEIKTDFHYTEFNRDDDLSESEARVYAREVFDNLTEEH